MPETPEQPEPAPPPTLAEYLAEAMKRPRPPFQPHATHNPDGNQLEVFWSDENYYGDPLPVETGLTLYRAESDHRVIGVCVHRLKSLLRE